MADPPSANIKQMFVDRSPASPRASSSSLAMPRPEPSVWGGSPAITVSLLSGDWGTSVRIFEEMPLSAAVGKSRSSVSNSSNMGLTPEPPC